MNVINGKTVDRLNKKLALKVKVKHLAEEAKIIRFEEQKTVGFTKEWLHEHRIHVVRPEARATHLAYAFAKGKLLNQVEKYPDNIPFEIWRRVDSMVAKYSDKSSSDYAIWKTAR